MWGAAATYLTGVRILLRHLISDRINFYCHPVFHSASRVCTGWSAVLLLFFYSVGTVQAASPMRSELTGITIVQSESSASYQEFTNSLREILLNRGVPISVIDADKPIPVSGLVIGVGMKAASVIASSSAPSVLNVLVPRAGYEKLLRDYPQRAGSRAFSAIFLDQPVDRQIRLIAAILPDKHHVGLLYSAPPEDIVQIRRKMAALGLFPHEQAVNSALPLSDALQELLQDSEVLLAQPDAAVYNSSTIRNILLATYRSGVPFVGFSPGYVKAGALCAVFTAPAQIAMQAAMLTRQFGETHALPAAQYPQEFEVMVNEEVARSLGLHIRSSPELHDEIKAAERGGP
jgi:hypothetical protein